MRGIRKRGKRRRLSAGLLSLCICLSVPPSGGTGPAGVASPSGGTGRVGAVSLYDDADRAEVVPPSGAAGAAGAVSAAAGAAQGGGSAENVIGRSADPNTMETYQDALLNAAEGSRYAGRIWTDKTVFASGAGEEEGGVEGDRIVLETDTDGYEGSVHFQADFAHVLSVLTSSQIVNEYPSSPIDLVIAFDMSASMGQDMRYGLDSASTHYQPHDPDGDTIQAPDGNPYPWPEGGVSMADRIANSRIQATLKAINRTIDELMAQNPQNRAAVCAYGANATVLMPLAHWRGDDKDGDGITDYLTVGGMETLYHPGDLQVEDRDGVKEWRWINNRDTCFTVAADARYNENTTSGFRQERNGEGGWVPLKRTVSNNVYGGEGKDTKVKAFPGIDVQTPEKLQESAAEYESRSRQMPGVRHVPAAKKDLEDNRLRGLMADTRQLKADEYIGYFTNTQGGIYLSYGQLARDPVTTYTEKRTDGKESVVARIPAAVFLSDGGANFALNRMGTGQPWSGRFGGEWNSAWDPTGESAGDMSARSSWYYTDQDTRDTKPGEEPDGYPGVDRSHRLRNGTRQAANVGDEWYRVYLPGADTLGREDYGAGLPSLYNVGADYYRDGTMVTKPGWYSAGVLYCSDNTVLGTSGVTLQVLLTASFMSAAVKQHYREGWAAGGAVRAGRTDLSTYTISVDSGNVPQWSRLRLYPSLDPKDYPLDMILTERWYTDEKRFGKDFSGAGGKVTKETVFQGLFRSWMNWKNGKDAEGMAEEDQTKISIKPIGGTDTAYSRTAAAEVTFGGNKMTVSNQDVIDNIAYNDGFYDIASPELDETFGRILELITGNVFVPVTGFNAAGADSSVTYQDPIGDYMEVKNAAVTAGGDTGDMVLLLFGRMYNLVRAGVYDYRFIEEKQKNGGFAQGWYSLKEGGAPEDPDGWVPKEDGSFGEGDVFYLDSGTLKDYIPIFDPSEGIVSEQQRNTRYTVYRFADAKEAGKLRVNPAYGDKVPSELQKAWAAAGDHEKKDNRLYGGYPGVYRLSDIRVWVEEYGDYVDTEGAITPEPSAYDTSLYADIPAAAIPTQLAEITLGRDGVLSYETNLGADHTVRDEKARDGAGNAIHYTEEEYRDYCARSSPVRLFYAVGLKEELLLRDGANPGGRVNLVDGANPEDGPIQQGKLNLGDGDGVQVSVDIGALSEEYTGSHTNPDNSVWFLSNSYSGTSCGDSAWSGRSCTRGDPTVSFSPGEDNRCYLFQEPRPLYAHAYRVGAHGILMPVDNTVQWDGDSKNKGGNGRTTWEDGSTGGAAWSGGIFAGTYRDTGKFQEAFEAGRQTGNGLWQITDDDGITYTLPERQKMEGCVVFLQDDLLEHVTSEGDGYADGSVSFAPDDYFFLTLQYYVPTSETGRDGSGEEVPGTRGGVAVQRVAARRGSEFGSGLNAGGINSGDMLCWADRNGRISTEIRYHSRSGTGDNTRGEPSYWKLFGTREELKAGLVRCGFEAGSEALEAEAAHWLDLRDRLADALLRADGAAGEQEDGTVSEEEFNAYFRFSVAAKSGSLRTGNLLRNRRLKGSDGRGNTTGTAAGCCVPAVDADSGTGGDVVINHYLGNNGRLTVANRNLAVTKLLRPPAGFPLTHEQMEKEFNFQVSIRDVADIRTASVLAYNPAAGVWQQTIGAIDVLTDNSSLLTYRDGGRALIYHPDEGVPVMLAAAPDASVGKHVYYIIDENDGTWNPETDRFSEPDPEGAWKKDLFYVYLPSNENAGTEGDPNSRRVWPAQPAAEGQEPDSYRSDHDDGSQTYSVRNAELIPWSEVQEAETGAGGAPVAAARRWSHDLEPHGPFGADGGATEHRPIEKLDLMTTRPVSRTGRLAFTSPFRTETTWETRELIFGQDAETDEDGAARHTAGFTLKSGEGLLLTGLQSGRDYRFTEMLSDADIAAGYRFDNVRQVQQAAENQPVGVSSSASQSVESWSAESQSGGIYSVFGVTGGLGEQAHFTNTFVPPGSISVTKQLNAAEGAKLNERDFEIEFRFKLKLEPDTGVTVGTPSDASFSYVITEQKKDGAGNTTEDSETVREGRLLPQGEAGSRDPSAQDILSDPGGGWTFLLKGGQTMTVYGITAGTGYTYTIAEMDSEGYTVTASVNAERSGGGERRAGKEGESGGGTEYIVSGTVAADSQTPVEVTFVNTKEKPAAGSADLDLTKKLRLRGDVPESAENSARIKEGDYVFCVFPEKGNPEDDPIRGIPWNPDTQTGWDEQAGALLVRNGAPEQDGTDQDGTDQDGTSAGAVIFKNLLFNQAGTYVYTVLEQTSCLPGISSDGSVYTVTVDVEERDDGTGRGSLNPRVTVKKVVEPEGERAGIEFVNDFDKDRIVVPLRARKEFDGILREGQFAFLLEAVSGDCAATATAADGGSDLRRFGAFRSAATAPNGAGSLRSCGGAATEPDGRSGLRRSDGVAAAAAATSSNAETKDPFQMGSEPPGPVYDEIFPGRQDGSGSWVQGNTKEGWIDFGTIPFTQAGTYVYRLRELQDDGSPAGIRYSSAVYMITIRISRDEHDVLKLDGIRYDVSGGLAGEGETQGVPVFVNHIQTGILKISKSVSGAGDREQFFPFTVSLKDGMGEPLDGEFPYRGDGSFYGDPRNTGWIQDGGVLYLKDGENATIRELPVGTVCRVTETGCDGYAVTVNGSASEDGTFESVIAADEILTAEFENSRETSPDSKPENPPDTEPENPPESQPDIPPDTKPERPPDVQPEVPPDSPPDISPENQPDVPPNNRPPGSPGHSQDILPDILPNNQPDIQQETLSGSLPDTLPDQLPDTQPDDSPYVSSGSPLYILPDNRPPAPSSIPSGNFSGSSPYVVPDTGDERPIGFWLVLMALSLTAAVLSWNHLKKTPRREEKPSDWKENSREGEPPDLGRSSGEGKLSGRGRSRRRKKWRWKR